MALEIFILNTGQGDCTFIKFPNGKTMLVDINQTNVDVDIFDFLKEKIPLKKHDDIEKTCRRLNYFVNTHPHEDHLRGVGGFRKNDFFIDEVWESGHRLHIPRGEENDYAHYLDFLNLLKSKSYGVKHKVAASRTPVNIGSTSVYIFAPSKYLSDEKDSEEIHKRCMVLKLEYMGNSILLTGDSNRDAWENRIVPYYSDDKEVDGEKLLNLLDSTVLHASHHGSKYFFVAQNDEKDRYTSSVEKVSPSFTVISVGKDNSFGHPHQIALNIYKDNTKHNRVWKTKDDKSIWFAFTLDGDVLKRRNLDYEKLLTITPEGVLKKDKEKEETFKAVKEGNASIASSGSIVIGNPNGSTKIPPHSNYGE